MLTEKQEMWSDSIDFYRPRNHVILRRDVQIDDTEHKVLAFGDYGEYWKEPGNALLTRDPAVVSYDLSQGDSLFMRSDSMFLFTINEAAERRAAERRAADSLARAAGRFRRPIRCRPRRTPKPGRRTERIPRESAAIRCAVPRNLRRPLPDGPIRWRRRRCPTRCGARRIRCGRRPSIRSTR